jgi:hypothetical protein
VRAVQCPVFLVDRKNKPRIRSAREYRICRISLQRLARLGRGDTLLRWDTWTEFASDCGESRIWAGVHFPAAVEASTAICDDFGEMAHAYLLALIDGSAPARPPSRGTRGDHH